MQFSSQHYCISVVQFGTAGQAGTGHGADYRIVDENLYYVETAKIFAICGYRLLKDDAAAAKDLLIGFQPSLTAEGYRKYLADNQKFEHMDPVPVPSFED